MATQLDLISLAKKGGRLCCIPLTNNVKIDFIGLEYTVHLPNGV